MSPTQCVYQWLMLLALCTGSGALVELVLCPGSPSRPIDCAGGNDIIHVDAANLIFAFGSDHCADADIISKVTSLDVVACSRDLKPFTRCHGLQTCNIDDTILNTVIYCGVYLRNPNLFYMKYSCVQETTSTTTEQAVTESQTTTTTAATTSVTTVTTTGATTETTTSVTTATTETVGGTEDVQETNSNTLVIGVTCGAIGGIVFSVVGFFIVRVCILRRKIKPAEASDTDTKAKPAKLEIAGSLPVLRPARAPARDALDVVRYTNRPEEGDVYDYIVLPDNHDNHDDGYVTPGNFGVTPQHLGTFENGKNVYLNSGVTGYHGSGSNHGEKSEVRASRDSADYCVITEPTYQPLEGVRVAGSHNAVVGSNGQSGTTFRDNRN